MGALGQKALKRLLQNAALAKSLGVRALEKAADGAQLLVGNDGSIVDLNTGIDLSISGSNPLNLNTGLKLGDILDLDVDADSASTVLSIGKDGSILDLDTGLDGTQLLIGNDGSILNLDTGHGGTQLSVGGSNLLDIDLGNVNLNGGLNLGDVLDLDVDADAGNVVLSIGKDGSIVDLDTGLDGTQLLIEMMVAF